jgi:hypothetical protein
MLTATNLGLVQAEYSPLGPHAAHNNLGLTMVDPNPMYPRPVYAPPGTHKNHLGYVFRDEGPYMNPPLQGIMDVATWAYSNKKPIAIGAGLIAAAAIAYSLLR